MKQSFPHLSHLKYWMNISFNCYLVLRKSQIEGFTQVKSKLNYSNNSPFAKTSDSSVLQYLSLFVTVRECIAHSNTLHVVEILLAITIQENKNKLI